MNYCYWILDEEHNTVKIGFSKDPWERLQAFQKPIINRLDIIALFSGGKVAEQAMHERFEHIHIVDELFSYTEEMQRFLNKSRMRGFACIGDCTFQVKDENVEYQEWSRMRAYDSFNYPFVPKDTNRKQIA